MCNYCYTVFTRSRAIEEFLCGIRFSCRNQQYGCDVFLLHREMREHERFCHREPCFCPVPHCGFAGQPHELKSHLATLHRWDVIKFRYGKSFEAPVHKSSVFCCEDYSELFHIVRSREGYGYGTALSMICIRPDNAWNAEFTYELKMPAGGQHRLQMQSTVWNTSLRYRIGEGSDMFLLVPDKLPGNVCSSVVDVCISKVAAGRCC
jgi:E3 ubiquitin-protein ligase SIAH1